MAFYQETPFHNGELSMQSALKVPSFDNPTFPALSPQLANHLRVAPLIAIGTLDSEGRPWTTLWGNGDKGFAQALTNAVIGIRTAVAGTHDPVVEELVGKEATGEVIQETGNGRMVSGLTIDLETRKRVKLYGRMVAGALSLRDDEVTDSEQHVAEVQLVLKIEQSLGNCPKYLNKKRIIAGESRPQLVSDSPRLPLEAVALLEKADLFFISSAQLDLDMDTNHRGGPPGFMRVVSNDESGAVLVYPEYSGNRLYQTLGNLKVNPKAGICVPDFENGNMLYLTGTTEILVGEMAAEVLPRSNLAVKITITAARFVFAALPFRGVPGDLSPYNPSVRYLPSEKSAIQSDSQNLRNATLLSQTKLTPTISRFRFALDKPATYEPGQYVTLNFERNLSMGYSHMRDDDPRSLNDDFVRTFTVSNAHPDTLSSSTASSPNRAVQRNQFEITIRRVGVATEFLFRHHGKEADSRDDLDVAIQGFGGDFRLDQDDSKSTSFFVAAGVGVTPLLASLDKIDFSRLRVLWTVRQADIPLVLDVLDQQPKIKSNLAIFVTDDTEGESDGAKKLREGNVNVHFRRMQKDDLTVPGTEASEYYICTAVPMRRQITEWLPGKKVSFEDFNF